MSDEAPYGYTLDGKPKKAPGGRPPGSGTKTGRFGRRKAATPRKRAAPNNTNNTGPRKAGVDYSATVAEVFMSFGGIVALGSPLDGAVFIDTAAEWGEVGNELAQINDHVRRACDKAMTVGPWGRVSALLLKTAAQIAENHQWLPHAYTRAFGAKPRAQYAHEFQQRVDAMAAEWMSQQESAAPYPADSQVPFERRDARAATV